MTDRGGVVMLVGAGDAIGAAVARRFAEGGYKVCIARRDAAKSKRLVDELTAKGHDIHAFSVDARGKPRCRTVCPREQTIGPIEVCLFNAGSNVNKPLLETTESCSSRHGNWPAMGVFWSAARPPATCSARPRHHPVYGRHRQHSRRQGLCGVFRRRSSACAPWPRRWLANSDRRIFTWSI